MKKTIGILLVSIFLLSACSIDWNDEKDVKIAVLEKQVAELEKTKENDFFKKKEGCASLRDKIDIYLGIPSPGGVILLFYSPKRNSCVYTYTSFKDGFFWEEMIDYLNGESLISCLHSNGKTSEQDRDCLREFDKLVIELQNQ